ncbi:MAG: diguanylate cyclase [Planctomycetota bacterium]
MWDWFERAFATDAFPPRWSCGSWPAWLGWLHIISDLLTFAAYTAIPFVLASFLWRRRDLPFPRVLALFATFIFACGTVHLLEAMIFWWPVYPASGVAKAVTATVSLATVIALVPTMRHAMRLPVFQEVTARLVAIVSASGDAIIAKDREGNVTHWNAAATRMFGYSADEMCGQPFLRVVPDDRQAEMAVADRCASAGQTVEPFETEHLSRDGRRIPVSLSLSPLRDRKRRVVGISGISRDISEQKMYEAQLEAAAVRLERANLKLRELADRDPLTALLNRRGFEVVLAVEAARLRRHGSSAAVILIDIDDFKAVNEQFGHNVGDQVLRTVAARIEDAVRESDRVARIGGDEFLVLAVETRVSEAMQQAERLRLAVASEPVETSAGPVSVQISCGVESVDPDRPELDAIVADSSQALGQAKRSGKNVVSSSHRPAAVGVTTREQLHAVMQPIVALCDGETVGWELLIRGPKGPLESPNRLFQFHRELNLLTAMDLACLDCCLSGMSQVAGERTVHVNVFPSTLLEVDLDLLAERLQRVDDPRRLCLEINEQMVVGDPQQLVDRVHRLRSRVGCLIAIDDVGYGRSSLEALILLEADTVKIDRRFVHEVAEERGARRRLERLVQTARALDARVIAEGVERAPDRDVLRDIGVEFAQGYLFGRPTALNGRMTG